MMASATEADLVVGTRGEFIFPRFIPAYDGMFAAAMLLEALARSGRKLSEAAAAYPPIHVGTRRIACPWGRKGAVMRRLIEATEHEERQLVDGVKVWRGPHEWVLVIPHSDRPTFVVTAQAETPERTEALLAEYGRLVERWRDEP